MFICSWVSSRIAAISLVATDENHSHKQPAPVMDTFFASIGCLLMETSNKECEKLLKLKIHKYLGCVREDITNKLHGRLWWKDVRITHHEFL